ncbi:homocysteine S-methyltransferase family protein [Devosia sp.]|uniref:homocysteine S-methyltransferase family protein n=1 Tax=Devosia sp. TaxID=1871048 RepID=UPI0019F51CEA|nr:homocysteine S-methyltransferase family protein [Devosia sp.]MBE0578949.1 homocysteine S-methyltransferase family protein [Devosia sp.]
MARPQDLTTGDRRWLAWTGMETDLIFNQKWDLPGFAAFPLALSEPGRSRISDYYDAQMTLGRESGVGVILDSATWMANADRARPLGFEGEALARANAEAVALARSASERAGGVPVLVSGQVGPRGDAYQPGATGAAEAEAYHGEQIRALVAAGVDMISAYTLGSAEEAIGIARAAATAGVPAMISFTVETDGRLADGSSLGDAVEAVEAHTGQVVLGYCINCAHPDHFRPALDKGAWMSRLIGLIPNASRRSHAELDEATELDDGNPAELAADLGALHAELPGLKVFGGCCGTDMRHLKATSASVA